MAEGTCSREACERPIHCKGLCKSHYTVMRRNAPDRPRCSVDGCDRPRCSNGLCESHYAQIPEQREARRRSSREYARRNRAAIDEKYRAWLAANPEKRRAARRRWMRDWRHANPDAAREVMSRWIEANPERWAELRKAGSLTRRARKRGTQTEPIDLALVLAEHGMTCHICNDGIGTLDDLHFDHVIPLARGGTHTYDNLRPAHATCNLRKGAAMPA